LERLSLHIEALIFSSENAMSLSDIQNVLTETFGVEFPIEQIFGHVEDIQRKYQSQDFSIELVEISDGFRFLTKESFHNVIGVHFKQQNKKKLSRSALETLAIIAYKQPITKTELEEIRGVNCDYTVQKLLERELIEIEGRTDGPGRPLLYGTSEKFMDYLGLKSIQDLPKLKEIETQENSIGEPAPGDFVVAVQ
jgi:segregation and condensation protein B